MPIQVGIDLVSADTVEAALKTAHGERYLERVYTDRELEDCTTAHGVDPERLAARFAAKEATLKVLPAGDTGLSLRSIEVLRDPTGRVSIGLTGRAAELATSEGFVEFALSLSHEAGMAAAVVVARAPDEPAPT